MPDPTLIMVDVDDGREIEAEPLLVYRLANGEAEIHLPDGVILGFDAMDAIRLSAALRGHVVDIREAA